MFLKTHQLQAAYARRREIDNQRVERTAAVSRYYDHWDKVTSRFGNWTKPEYYKQVEDQLKQTKEKNEKQKQLEARRRKLQELLKKEQLLLDRELKERESPRSRRCTIDNETLENVALTAKERQNIKRKLELEAKLYGRWRHGVDDENLLFESKSNHEVLAKLNWLDKQVEDQRAREQEEAIIQERNLRLQEEIRKTEMLKKERQKIREQEIKEIRSLQDRHMDQLKEREREGDSLKEQEAKIRGHLKDLEKELDLIVESSAGALESEGLSQAYNLNKIKVYMRKRSEAFRNQIKLTINMLERARAYASNKSQLEKLLAKYHDQLDTEEQRVSQVDTMYESEAKSNLQMCEESWQTQQLERYHDVQQLLKDEQSALSAKLNGNLSRQEELLDLRSTHLSSIESSNEKLKELMKEDELDSPRLQSQFSTTNGASTGERMGDGDLKTNKPGSSNSATSISGNSSKTNFPKLTNSFANLNLDVWEDLASVPGGCDSPRLQSQRTLQVVTAENVERPKHARKRVAWT